MAGALPSFSECYPYGTLSQSPQTHPTEVFYTALHNAMDNAMLTCKLTPWQMRTRLIQDRHIGLMHTRLRRSQSLPNLPTWPITLIPISAVTMGDLW